MLQAKIEYGRVPNSLYGPSLVVGPTGCAAHNAGGFTWQSALCYYVGHRPGGPISADIKKLLETRLGGLKVLIFDEFSMLCLSDLFEIDRRLKLAKRLDPAAAQLPFGGVHIMFCGDFYQLPPVSGSPLYSAIDDHDAKAIDSAGRVLWESMSTYLELRTNHRFENAKGPLAKLAPAARLGIQIPGDLLDDINRICIAIDIDEAIADANLKALWIAPTNAECEGINIKLTARLVQSGAQRVRIFAYHQRSQKTPDPKFNVEQWKQKRRELLNKAPVKEHKYKGTGIGLNVLDLAIGSRVRATRNACTQVGIYQGAIGTVVGFGFPPGTSQARIEAYCNCKNMNDGADQNVMPPFVYVQLDHAANPKSDKERSFVSCFENMDGVVCFAPEKQEKSVDGYIRFMPFLVLAFASTYHKCQGLTCRNGVVMSPPNARNSDLGLTYVGYTRVVQTEDLILLGPLVPSHFTSKQEQRSKIVAEYERLKYLPGALRPAPLPKPAPDTAASADKAAGSGGIPPQGAHRRGGIAARAGAGSGSGGTGAASGTGAGIGDANKLGLDEAMKHGRKLTILPLDDPQKEQRRLILVETLSKIGTLQSREACRQHARRNMVLWAAAASTNASSSARQCRVLVSEGDWGEKTATLTKEYGTIFAVLNMANDTHFGGANFNEHVFLIQISHPP